MKAAASHPMSAAAEAVPAKPSRRTGSARRATWRALWLGAEVLGAAVRFTWLFVRRGGRPSLADRARRMQTSCRRILRIFAPELRITGTAPTRGLLVSNHLGYLDILVLGATAPCVFVAKSDVRGWPVVGAVAALAGTLFVRRDRRSDASRMTREMQQALGQGVLIVLFPEGTSSGGATVLPFKSALFGAVEEAAQSVAPAAIGYALRHGDAAEEVCYWKDMMLVPHLWNLLGNGTLRAELAFGPVHPADTAGGRRNIALQLHSEVSRLKHAIDVKLSS